MNHRLIACWIAAGWLLSGCAGLPEKTSASFPLPSDCPGQSAEALLSNGNQLGPASATHDLQCALATASRSDDSALLRTSLPARLALHLAERNPDPRQKKNLANEGVRLAKQAISLGAGKDGAVHYYLAANLGLAMLDDPLLSAASLSSLHDELKQAVALSPGQDEGGPLRLLGMLYLKAPPWPTGIGDGDKALDLLKQSVSQYPQHPLNHLFYAEALKEVDDQADQARSEYTKGQQALNDGQWGYNKDIWNQQFVAVANKLNH